MKSPFKFLDSYGKEDQEIYFGREEEVDKLHSVALQSKLVLVYGPSGTGKSSLIKCGLPNCFNDEDWFDIYITRDQNILDSLFKEINHRARTPIKPGTPIPDALQSLYLDNFIPIYLFFDQFEELYISGDIKEQEAFIQLVSEILDSDINCTIILAMREEYIAHLYDFELAVPKIMTSRLRVEPMRLENVKKVITASSEKLGIKLEENSDLAGRIIENIGGKRAGAVSLPFLQVYLDKLFREAFKVNKESITFDKKLVEKVGAIDDVLANFLDERISDIDRKLGHDEMTIKVLGTMITHEGTKKKVLLEEITHSLGKLNGSKELLKTCLSELEQARILNCAEGIYELAHDSLASEVYDHLSTEDKALRKVVKMITDRQASYLATGTLLSTDEINYLKPYKEKLTLKRDEKDFVDKSIKGTIRKRRASIAITTLVIIAISFAAVFSYIKMQDAIKATERAKKQAASSLAMSLNSGAKDLVLERNKTGAAQLVIMAIDSIERYQLPVPARLWNTLAQISQDTASTMVHRFVNTTGIRSVVFSPDGEKILTGSNDNTAILWDLDGNRLIEFIGHTAGINCAVFSPDGEKILTGSSDNTAILWDLDGNKLAEFIGHTSVIYSIAFSPDGQKVVTGSWDNTAGLWDLDGNKISEFIGHTEDINSTVFSPDEQKVLTGSRDSTAILWDLEGNKLTEFIGHTGEINSVAFTPDSQKILTGSWDKTAIIWDVDGNKIIELKGHTSGVNSVSYSPDGQKILTGSNDKTAILWNTEGNKLFELIGHTSGINSAAFNPDGRKILTGSWDGTAILWELNRKQLTEYRGTTNVRTVTFSPDGQKMLSGSWDKTATLWDINGKQLAKFTDHNQGVLTVAFSPDGQRILTGSRNDAAILWDLEGNKITEFIRQPVDVNSVAFSPNGQNILTGSYNQTAILWDLDGNKITEFIGHTENVISVAFSPDGLSIFTGSYDNTAILWDLDGNKLAEFIGHTSVVHVVAFSPDGQKILTGSYDNTAILWDLEGNKIAEFIGHNTGINTLAFSPDGQKIITGSWDKTAILWKVQDNLFEAEILGRYSFGDKYILNASFSETDSIIFVLGKGPYLASTAYPSPQKNLKILQQKKLDGLTPRQLSENNILPSVSSILQLENEAILKFTMFFKRNEKEKALQLFQELFNRRAYLSRNTLKTYFKLCKELEKTYSLEELALDLYRPEFLGDLASYFIDQVKKDSLNKRDYFAKAEYLLTKGQAESTARNVIIEKGFIDLKLLQGTEPEVLFNGIEDTRPFFRYASFFVRTASIDYDNNNFILAEKELVLAGLLYDDILAQGDSTFKSAAASCYNNIAFSQIFIKKFREAEQSAKRSIELGQGNIIYTNLALAYLFQGKYEQAKEVYLKWKDEQLYSELTFKQAFLEDFEDLENAGVTHPDVEKIKMLLDGKDPEMQIILE